MQMKGPVPLSHHRFDLLAAAVVALLVIGAAPMPPADFEPEDRPNERQIERRAEQHVLSPTEKILEQMKSSVCGTGPIYAGSVDAPVFVRPLLNMRCTLTQSEPRWEAAPVGWVQIGVTGTEDRPEGIRKATLIGSTFARWGTAEITGQWNDRELPFRPEVTSAHGSQLRIVNRATGETVTWVADGRTQKRIPSIVSVPPGSDVYYDVWDDYWPDNSDYLPDPARGRVWEVLD
jgi:hypothetical protein